MSPNRDKLIIKVRSNSVTNTARARGVKGTCSCTSSARDAATRLAIKAFGDLKFDLICEVIPSVCPPETGRYIATRRKP